MANDPPPPVRQRELGVCIEKRLEFRFDGLRDEPLRPRSQDFGERIVDFAFLPEGDNSILIHGVTLLLEVRVGCTPTPLRRSPHAVITQFPP
ncbi:hypothetical protein CQW49_07190 [Methylosinus trichosporium OB3b]|uniref:Uncharacterized protein n=1 Tax=Methylosinus trichosporium (strain ATCC 35070 / NCIMB 11131 / UNIQEM 75 / OB3b) TaxID=595536 RepID=A0A2D2CY81_METT3|nr:hypothetical protein CQW49_07190 [Methylosinus trichosporium OB3b]